MVNSQRPKILDDWIHVVLIFKGYFCFSSLLLQNEQCYSYVLGVLVLRVHHLTATKAVVK